MSKGFSLIEMLVVIGLVGLISILSFSGLNNSINFNQKVKEKSFLLEELSLFNEILKRDLNQSLDRLSRNQRGDRSLHSFYGENLKFEGDFLLLTINAPSRDFNKGSIRYVVYSYENNQINRSEFVFSDLSENTTNIKETLLSDVNSLKLVFGKGFDSFDEWPATPWTENNGIPNSLRIEIDLNSLGLIQRNYFISLK